MILSLGRDVSSAWLVWSSAVEAALADAYRFAGGPVPDNGLVLGRGVFRTRLVRLGGPKVRKARRNFADPPEGGEVSLYHDVSTAPLLGLRRRFGLVANLLSAMICEGEVIVQGDEGPVLGVAQVVDCHGVTASHEEREEEVEERQEVESDEEKTLKERCACPWMG